MRDAHLSEVKRQVELHDGYLIKTMGDGTLAVFLDPGAALEVALAITANSGAEGIGVRVGIHFGMMEVYPDDVHGPQVSLASRVGGFKESGIRVSDPARELILSAPLPSHEQLLWEREVTNDLKGFAQTFTLWRVKSDPIPTLADLPDGTRQGVFLSVVLRLPDPTAIPPAAACPLHAIEEFPGRSRQSIKEHRGHLARREQYCLQLLFDRCEDALRFAFDLLRALPLDLRFGLEWDRCDIRNGQAGGSLPDRTLHLAGQASPRALLVGPQAWAALTQEGAQRAREQFEWQETTVEGQGRERWQVRSGTVRDSAQV